MNATGLRPPANWISRYFEDPPHPNELKKATSKIRSGWWLEGCGVALFSAGVIAAGTLRIPVEMLLFLLSIGIMITGVKQLSAGFGEKRRFFDAMNRTLPRPSDQDMQRIIDTDSDALISRALSQLGLNMGDLSASRQGNGHEVRGFEDLVVETSSWGSGGGSRGDALLVRGPAFPCWSAIGDDWILRYSRYQIMVVCPTSFHLAIYRCIFDLYSGRMDYEQTHEYHYQDVVAVRTDTLPLGVPGISLTQRDSQRELFSRYDTMRQLRIIVASGDHCAITLKASSGAEVAAQYDDGAEFSDVLKRIRDMLRDKKGGTFQFDRS